MTCMATLSIPGFDCISTKTEYHEVLTLMSKPSPSIPNFFITGRAVDFSRSTWQGTVRLNPDAHPCACRELKTTFQNPRINPVSSQQQADAVQFPWQHLSPMSSIHTSQGFLFCMICWQYLIWNNAPWRKGLKRTIQRLACVQRMWQKKGCKRGNQRADACYTTASSQHMCLNYYKNMNPSDINFWKYVYTNCAHTNS